MKTSAGPQVDIQLGDTRVRRRALAEALRSALEGAPGGPWRARLTGALVYASPSVGRWWWKATLVPATGQPVAVFLDPEHQSAAHLREAVAAAARGESLTVVCSSCGRVRLGEGWHRRPDLKALRLSHGICPECIERIYPEQARRIRARAHKRT